MKVNNETLYNRTNLKNTSLANPVSHSIAGSAFKGAEMSPLSKALYTLGNNDMLNASAIDIFAMDTPRTVIEFNNRGKNAGIEMGFREYSGTFIAEFSAALFAFLTSKIMSRTYKPDIKVNSNSWATNNALDTFNEIYQNSDKSPAGFVKDSLFAMRGVSGNKIKDFSKINSEKTNPIIEKLTGVITNSELSKKDTKNILQNIQTDIIEILGADNNITIGSANHEFKSNLTHTLRDITDLGKNVFFKDGGKGSEKIIQKLKTINNSRIMLAIPASMLLAISNQYINRKLTKKRTGIDNFVGENNYEANVKNNNEQKKEKGLLGKKMLSAGVFLFMLSKVMDIKKPSDLINKLEFDGPATGGNAIKTIYGTLILGRIFASKDSTELRETNTRDYLGFLNWLVFGGFVAKGAAQLLDPKKENLFNIQKQGKGLSHWLKDISLKSQKEVIAQGGNIKKNLRNLNIAQLTGIAYSAAMLGIFLPKLNIYITRHNGNKNNKQTEINNKFQSFNYLKEYTIDEFDNRLHKKCPNKFSR